MLGTDAYDMYAWQPHANETAQGWQGAWRHVPDMSLELVVTGPATLTIHVPEIFNHSDTGTDTDTERPFQVRIVNSTLSALVSTNY